MALKEHMNNCARPAQPGIWIFHGKATVLLVIGFAFFILIMQCLRAVQLEMPIAIVISAPPTLATTAPSSAKAIEWLRVKSARLMMKAGRFSAEEIARKNGFGNRERMRRSFVRAFGQSPQTIQRAVSA
jgi:AraC-like DNA-binding protein